MAFIIWPSDLQAELDRLAAGLNTFNTAVASCTGIDSTTLAEWNTFYAAASAYASKPASWIPGWPGTTFTTADAGDTVLAYERELAAWQQRLSTVCKNAAPSFNVFSPTPIGADTVISALKFAAVIAVAAGGAYVVKEGIGLARDLLPSKSQPKKLPTVRA